MKSRKPQIIPPLDLGPGPVDRFWPDMTTRALALPDDAREIFICSVFDHPGHRKMLRDLVKLELWKREVLEQP